MFNMDLPWWELIVRATLVFVVLLIMVRVSGRRTVGQFTSFDLLVVMLLSEAVSNALNGGDNSVGGGLILAATLVLLNMGASWLSSRSKKMAELLDGSPVLLGRHGKLFDEVLKKCRLSKTEVQSALHEADCELKEIKYMFLEADGNITVLKAD